MYGEFGTLFMLHVYILCTFEYICVTGSMKHEQSMLEMYFYVHLKYSSFMLLSLRLTLGHIISMLHLCFISPFVSKSTCKYAKKVLHGSTCTSGHEVPILFSTKQEI